MSRSENIHGNLLLLNVKFISSDDPKVRNESKKCEQNQNHTTRTFLVLAADVTIVTADIVLSQLKAGYSDILDRGSIESSPRYIIGPPPALGIPK